MAEQRSTLKSTDLTGQQQAPPPQPGLLVVSSAGKSFFSIFRLPEFGEFEFGRDNLGAQVGDRRISRQHARVYYKDGTFFARDLGSLNGTATDGQLILPHTDSPFERCLRLGNTLLVPEPDVAPLRGGVIVRGELVLGPRLAATYLRIVRIAASSMTLHITGETGSGKEHAARAFHNASPTNRGPFVAVNCAAIPEGIAERLLFGARRGAFSGITEDAQGYLQAADGGTLFLDEVAELHATVQAKLLRVLETREVLSLGALRPQSVTVRVCSASHRLLDTEVAAGRLREDLYYRIGRPVERVPPLRERPEEIPWLIERELQKINPDLCAHALLVEACILRYWPGNVRELLIDLQTAAQEAIGQDSQRVKVEHLSPTAGLLIAPGQSTLQALERPPPAALTAPPAARPNRAAAARPDRAAAARPSRAQILAALIGANGNISAASRELGVHRSKLKRHMDYHGIDIDRLRDLGKS